MTLNANEGNIIGETQFEINTFLSWELSGYGTFENGYYTFGDGIGTLTAKYISEVNLPNAEKSGYVHTGWFTSETGGEKVGNAGDIYVPTKAVTLYAQYEKDKFELEVKTNPNASGTVLGVKTYCYDEDVTLIAKPIVGYEFLNWEVEGIYLDPTLLTVDTLSFKMPSNKVTVTANFASYTTITSISGDNGGIRLKDGEIKDAVSKVIEGKDITYEIVPDIGYQVLEVFIDDISIGPVDSYTFYNVIGTHKIEVTFEPIKIYGIRRALDSESSAWERVEDSVGLIANATKDGTEVENHFDNIYPWSEIKSYNYSPELDIITAWYGDDNFKFDGSNGEVLTRIPEFYYKHYTDENYEYYNIAKYEVEGYIKSEEFSVGRYKMSEIDGVAHSYSGTIPSVNANITQHRNFAKALGSGFGQLDWRYFTIQMLYLVEYADYNSQNMLGNGISSLPYSDANKALIDENNTNRIVISSANGFIVGQMIDIDVSVGSRRTAKDRTITVIESYNLDGTEAVSITFDGAPVDITTNHIIYSCGQKSGQLDSLGMKSGSLENDGKHSVMYRGIEDVFGNVFEFIDGININNYEVYVCFNPEKYAVDTFNSDYIKLNYTIPEGAGYPDKLTFDSSYPLITMPKSTGNGIIGGDYYTVQPDVRFLRVGGSFELDCSCGLWYFNAYSDSSGFSMGTGARLLKY